MEPARDLLAAAVDLQPETIALRRMLHRRPEVGLSLPETQAAILTAIDGLPLTVTKGRQVSSVVGVLEGGRPGPTVLLRGDMDALPMPEDTGLDFASEMPGVMHACGHDTHVAMLVSAARMLCDRQADLPGRVVFMWQPGEEGFGGAPIMLEEGVLDAAGAAVESAYALHISTQQPSGYVAVRPGSAMASSDTVRITVTGRGAHASNPSAGLDPIPVAAAIVQAIQVMVTREVSVFDPAVITIAKIAAGTTDNVIPERAEMLGTMRALSEETRAAVKEKLHRLATSVAAGYGASAEVHIEEGYPVTVNDESAADLVHSTALALIGPDRALLAKDPIMGAEDFSYVLQRVPGAMAWLGACPPGLDPETAPSNHSNRVVFDEDAMAVGVATHVATALAALDGKSPAA
jgi:amidohydrolase